MTVRTDDRVSDLIATIIEANPMQRATLDAAQADLRKEERKHLMEYLNYCEEAGLDLDQLADAYNTITWDTLREQMYFKRAGKYRYSRFEDVAGSVYHNPSYMQKYMYGLAITAYLWANHREIYRYFEKVIPRNVPGRYLEIGPGHGLFLSRAMAVARYGSYEGIDISETSLRMTRDLLSRQEGVGHDWSLLHGDFLQMQGLAGPYDAVVMGEVLEHVEQPERFLQRVHELVRPGGFVFVTTAVNAPAVDHIYLFRTVAEVEDMALRCGLRCADKLAAGYPGCSIEETEHRQLPLNVALVLSR